MKENKNIFNNNLHLNPLPSSVQKDRCHNPRRRNRETTSYYLNFRATKQSNSTRQEVKSKQRLASKSKNLNAFRQIRLRNRSPALGRREMEVKENCESEGKEIGEGYWQLHRRNE